MKYLAGFALPFVILLFLMYFVRGQKPVTYDERQTAVRSTAYKYALITGVLAGFAASFLLDLRLLPMDGSFALITVSYLMICIYVVYSIWKGVFFGISGSWKRWALVICILGVTNFFIGITKILQEGLPEGILTSNNTDIITGTLFLIIFAAAILSSRKMNDEDQ